MERYYFAEVATTATVEAEGEEIPKVTPRIEVSFSYRGGGGGEKEWDRWLESPRNTGGSLLMEFSPGWHRLSVICRRGHRISGKRREVGAGGFFRKGRKDVRKKERSPQGRNKHKLL